MSQHQAIATDNTFKPKSKKGSMKLFKDALKLSESDNLDIRVSIFDPDTNQVYEVSTSADFDNQFILDYKKKYMEQKSAGSTQLDAEVDGRDYNYKKMVMDDYVENGQNAKV